MQAPKPYYNVGFWEYVFDREKARYMALIMRKAKLLKVLEGKDLFALPEVEATKAQRQIDILTDELNVLYGFKIFTDEMRSCYIDSTDKIYEAYSNRAFIAEVRLYELQRDYNFLCFLYDSSLDTAILLCDKLINKLQSNE